MLRWQNKNGTGCICHIDTGIYEQVKIRQEVGAVIQQDVTDKAVHTARRFAGQANPRDYGVPVHSDCHCR